MGGFVDALVELIAKGAISVGSGFLLAFPMMWAVNYLFTPQILHQVFGVWSFDWSHGLMLGVLFSFFHNSKT
jgi:hypothetical protein